MGHHHPPGYLLESVLNPNAVVVEGRGYTDARGRSIMPELARGLTVAEPARPRRVSSNTLRRGGRASLLVWTGVSLPVCVFDLDHTAHQLAPDLRAVGREMERLIRAFGLTLPQRELRWTGAELLAVVRREAPALEAEVLAIPVAHERRAMELAELVPHAMEAVTALRDLGYAIAVWTNNDRVVADYVLGRFGLLPHPTSW